MPRATKMVSPPISVSTFCSISPWSSCASCSHAAILRSAVKLLLWVEPASHLWTLRISRAGRRAKRTFHTPTPLPISRTRKIQTFDMIFERAPASCLGI